MVKGMKEVSKSFKKYSKTNRGPRANFMSGSSVFSLFFFESGYPGCMSSLGLSFILYGPPSHLGGLVLGCQSPKPGDPDRWTEILIELRPVRAQPTHPNSFVYQSFNFIRV